MISRQILSASAGSFKRRYRSIFSNARGIPSFVMGFNSIIRMYPLLIRFAYLIGMNIVYKYKRYQQTRENALQRHNEGRHIGVEIAAHGLIVNHCLHEAGIQLHIGKHEQGEKARTNSRCSDARDQGPEIIEVCPMGLLEFLQRKINSYRLNTEIEQPQFYMMPQPDKIHDQKIGDKSTSNLNTIILRYAVGISEDTHGISSLGVP